MNKNSLRKLAQYTVQEPSISDSSAAYIVSKLSREELKHYRALLKHELRKTKALITTAEELSPKDTLLLEGLLPGKKIITAVDPSLGAGLQILCDDILVNAHVKNFVTQTFNRLKEKL